MEVDVRAWSAIPEEQRAEAKRRLQVITPLIEWQAGHRLAYTLRDGSAVCTDRDMARYLAEQNSVSYATLWRWRGAFKKDGMVGLVRERRADATRSKYFETHAEAAKFVLAKYHELGQCSPTGSPNLALVYDELRREYSRLYGGPHPIGKTTSGQTRLCECHLRRRPVSYPTVRAFLSSLPPVVRDAARLPRQKHDAKYSPFVLTKMAERVNDIWVCDHRVLDVLSYNDYFSGAEFWRLLRVWVTTIEDMCSRVVWSTCCATPSWRSIAGALRLGMSRFGRPRVFYIDNGKDFKKVGGAYVREAQDTDENGRIVAGQITENLLQRLGIVPQYCLPFHPRSKCIESYHATVSKRFDVMFGKGYAGAKPSLRPDQCREAEKRHHLWLDGKSNETPFLPASHVVKLMHAWEEEYNAFHIHDGYGMNGRAPYDVMRELLPNPEPVDIVAIEPLFWAHEPRTVGNCTVQINKQAYEGESEHDAAAMYGANGTEIVIAYDPDNLDRALAIAGGKIIARLHRQPRVDRGLPGERSPQTEAEIKSKLRMGRAAHRQIDRFWHGPTPTQIAAGTTRQPGFHRAHVHRRCRQRYPRADEERRRAVKLTDPRATAPPC